MVEQTIFVLRELLGGVHVLIEETIIMMLVLSEAMFGLFLAAVVMSHAVIVVMLLEMRTALTMNTIKALSVSGKRTGCGACDWTVGSWSGCRMWTLVAPRCAQSCGWLWSQVLTGIEGRTQISLLLSEGSHWRTVKMIGTREG